GEDSSQFDRCVPRALAAVLYWSSRKARWIGSCPGSTAIDRSKNPLALSLWPRHIAERPSILRLSFLVVAAKGARAAPAPAQSFASKRKRASASARVSEVG